jgi:hypothetical protein
MIHDRAFSAWKERAENVGLLVAAQQFGAKLKRAGSEWMGPCCFCGGRDRLGINLGKGKWHCRGHGGGESPITLAMHLGNISWKTAIEQLTGEPCPTGPAKPLSEAEKAERNRKRLEAESAQRAREAEQERYESNTRETSLAIWNASEPLKDTLAATYLCQRGLIFPEWPSVLRFHPALPYPGKSKRYPVLVCRVDDISGDLTGVWRTFLREDGRKADVETARLGLGPVAGGAVRIGGLASKIAVGEGIESALGYWLLTGQKQPTWAALSTSGLIGFEAPLGVEHCVIAPDGDAPIRKQGNDFAPSVPAGRKAALALRTRLLAEGVSCTIAAEPPCGRDFNDLWLAHCAEVA